MNNNNNNQQQQEQQGSYIIPLPPVAIEAVRILNDRIREQEAQMEEMEKYKLILSHTVAQYSILFQYPPATLQALREAGLAIGQSFSLALKDLHDEWVPLHIESIQRDERDTTSMRALCETYTNSRLEYKPDNN